MLLRLRGIYLALFCIVSLWREAEVIGESEGENETQDAADKMRWDETLLIPERKSLDAAAAQGLKLLQINWEKFKDKSLIR